MSTYEPGTVAIATVRGVPNVRVMRVDDDTFPWTAADGHRQYDREVTDIRPLVVLGQDLSDLDLEGAAKALRATFDFNGTALFLEELIAQTTPRIPEPGWSGVVEASTPQNSDRLRWQRDSGTHAAHWVCEDINEYDRAWDDLIDPTLIRDGIEATS